MNIIGLKKNCQTATDRKQSINPNTNPDAFEMACDVEREAFEELKEAEAEASELPTNQYEDKKMKITNETQRQFAKSITEAIEFLNDEDSEMSDPCIYAETGGANRRDMGFHFGSKIHMQEGDVLWMMVEPDSFGDFDPSADPEDEASGIVDNMWVDAVRDISDNM